MAGFVNKAGTGLGGVEPGLWGGNSSLYSGASGLEAGDGGPSVQNGFLLESGSGFILLEDGSFLIQE